MKLPKRKPNRLTGYDYSSCGAYFVTLCVKDRLQRLGEIVGDDAHIVPIIALSETGLVVQKYIKGMVGVDQYVIMPNHIHLIIQIPNTNSGTMWASSPTPQSISQRMKSFKTLVTKEIGCSIWQRSFYDHVIRNEEEYQKIWRYIDENPVKWEEDRFYEVQPC